MSYLKEHVVNGWGEVRDMVKDHGERVTLRKSLEDRMCSSHGRQVGSRQIFPSPYIPPNALCQSQSQLCS